MNYDCYMYGEKSYLEHFNELRIAYLILEIIIED